MTFFFLPNTIRVTLKNILALPSFIMGVNELQWCLAERRKSYSSEHHQVKGDF